MDEYNALYHYAKMRSECVADLPTNTFLDNVTEEEEQLIINGIPLVREAILSIYQSVAEFASDNYVTPRIRQILNEKGGFMRCNNEAQGYLNTIFHSLLSIARDGKLVDNRINVSKEYLQKLSWNERHKLKYKHDLTRHFEYFCNVECYKNNELSTYRKCDTVTFFFDTRELPYTLHHMAIKDLNPFYFQYGDLRMYSESECTEDTKRFPQSVRKKVVGELNYKYYPVLKDLFYTYFKAEPEKENPYQGYGEFGLIEEYNTNLENTSTNITARKDRLILGIRMGFEAFQHLPGIIADLSSNVQQGIFSTPECVDCPLHCNSKRRVEFDEAIYPKKILAPCKCSVSECDINSEIDIKSVELLFNHIIKYSKAITRKCKT